MSQIHVDILKNAKEHIKKGHTSFICIAVSFVALRMGKLKEGGDITRHISNRMLTYDSLDAWLHCVAKVPLKDLTKQNMKAYRLRYIDRLITIFEKV